MFPSGDRWDIFICYASEDKSAVASPLAQALARAGLKVWYDEFSLRLGDSLLRSIDNGLRESRYGVVILSPNFFAKEWPQKELDGLAALERGGVKKILPVWHNVTRDDILRYSPMLAGKVAVSTSKGFDTVVREIIRLFSDRFQELLRSFDNQVEELNKSSKTFEEAYGDSCGVVKNAIHSLAETLQGITNELPQLRNINSYRKIKDNLSMLSLVFDTLVSRHRAITNLLTFFFALSAELNLLNYVPTNNPLALLIYLVFAGGIAAIAYAVGRPIISFTLETILKIGFSYWSSQIYDYHHELVNVADRLFDQRA